MMEFWSREQFENFVLEKFKGVIMPLQPESAEVIEQFKDGSFGFGCLGLTLYTNGYNLRGISRQYPQGLFYYDGENIFGVGFFQKELADQHQHAFIVAPRGRRWLQAVNHFVDFLRQANIDALGSIYVRHLTESQYHEMLAAGYSPIFKSPWHPVAHSEDETHNHRLIDLDKLIEVNSDGALTVKTLDGVGNVKFRRRPKAAYYRFGNFLQRNKLDLVIEEYIPHRHQDLALNMIARHFGSLKNAIGSTPEDYWGLVYFQPLEIHRQHFFRYIGYLKQNEMRIPILLFMGENIDSDTVGLYASFALRDQETLNALPEDSAGFSALSRYCYLKIFGFVRQCGFRYVDMGGSETYELDHFKRELGAKELRTYWVVAN